MSYWLNKFIYINATLFANAATFMGYYLVSLNEEAFYFMSLPFVNVYLYFTIAWNGILVHNSKLIGLFNIG